MEKIKIDREVLFNSKIEVEYFEIDSEGESRLWNLFQKYQGKRAAENYTKEVFDDLIRLKRFSGALEIKFNGETFHFCALSERNGWIIITRYVRLKRIMLPPMAGIAIPFIEENLLSGKKGIVMTFNDYNKALFDMFPGNADQWDNMETTKELVDHSIFQTAKKTVGRIIKLNNQLIHHNTLQWIAYLPKDNDVPFD